jgi:hypothetical protein
MDRTSFEKKLGALAGPLARVAAAGPGFDFFLYSIPDLKIKSED